MFYIFNERSKSLLDAKSRKTFDEAAEDAQAFVEERLRLGAEASEYPLTILEAVARVGEEPTPVKVTKIKKS